MVRKEWITVTVVALLAGGLCGPGVPSGARADAIHTWEGAGARFDLFGNVEESQGPTASLSSGERDGPIELWIDGIHHPVPSTVRGSADVEVNARSRDLIHVRTSYEGSTGSAFFAGGNIDVDASGRRIGDAVSVQVPGDSRDPAFVRLEFGLDARYVSTFNPSGTVTGEDYLGSIRLSFGDRDVVINPGYTTDHHLLDSFTDNWSAVSATFHLDLPIDADGRSIPFDLEVGSQPRTAVLRNWSLTASHDITLSLLDVTLPDGTSLDDAGYAASFDSGLTWGAPVPEPGSVAVWAAAGAGAVIAAYRSRTRKAG